MRDPNRIQRIVSLLEIYWVQHPDLRLGQIVGNFTPVFHGDPYYVEDDVIEDALHAVLDGRGEIP